MLDALPSLKGVHLVLNESVWFPGRSQRPDRRPDVASLDILRYWSNAHEHVRRLVLLLRERRLFPGRTTVFVPQSCLY